MHIIETLIAFPTINVSERQEHLTCSTLHHDRFGFINCSHYVPLYWSAKLVRDGIYSEATSRWVASTLRRHSMSPAVTFTRSPLKLVASGIHEVISFSPYEVSAIDLYLDALVRGCNDWRAFTVAASYYPGLSDAFWHKVTGLAEFTR